MQITQLLVLHRASDELLTFLLSSAKSVMTHLVQILNISQFSKIIQLYHESNHTFIILSYL